MKVNTRWWLAAGVVVSSGIVVSVSEFTGASAGSGPTPLVICLVGVAWLLLFIIGYWLAIAVHEAGHVIAGLVLGFKFQSMEVMNVGLNLSDRGLRMFFLRDRLAGGLTRMMPPSTESLLSRYRWFILGGPIASVLYLGMAVWAVWFVVPQHLKVDPFYLRSGLLFVFAPAVLLLPGTLFPATIKGHDTDALQVWQLRLTDPNRGRLLANFQLHNQIHMGLRAKDWSQDLLRLLESPYDGSSLEMVSRFLRYVAFADRGDVTAAWQELRRAAEICGALGEKAGIFKQLISREQAFAAYWWLKDLDLGNGFGPFNPNPHEMVRTTHFQAAAAKAILEERWMEAEVALTLARTHLKHLYQRIPTREATSAAWMDAMEVSITEGISKATNHSSN